MGGDKPWQPFGATSLFGQAWETLSEVAEPVYVVGVEAAERARFEALAPTGIFLDDDRLGPLSGLLTGLEASSATWSQVLAVDMPLVTPDLLRGLAEAANLSEADAVVPQGKGRLQPLAGLYRGRCGPGLRSYLRQGGRRVFGWLDTLRVETWPVPADWQVTNVNTQEELAQAARLRHTH